MNHPPSDDLPLYSLDDLIPGNPVHNLDDLTKWKRDNYTCDGLITRQWEEDACGKTAVAAITTWDDYYRRWHTWPVCAYHANRYAKNGEMVPLYLLMTEQDPRDGLGHRGS